MRRLTASLIPAFVAVTAPISGCGVNTFQSMMHPAGADAERIAVLTWILIGICTGIFALVLLALILSLVTRTRKGEEGKRPGSRFIVITGILIPSVILIGILILTLEAVTENRSAGGEDPSTLRVKVTGHQFWWEVEYPAQGIVTANEIHLPAGRPVRLELTASDVIHSFWVPALNGKMDMFPGTTTYLRLNAEIPGRYRGQCAEFCGVQHALMAFIVEVLPPEGFAGWVAEKQRPVPEPVHPETRRGREVFFEAACHNCHAIRGTEAVGRIGPDLTHVGSRLTIGAGTLPNSHGTLSGWILNPQTIKPGNLMPASYLEPSDLHALMTYMQSLK